MIIRRPRVLTVFGRCADGDLLPRGVRDLILGHDPGEVELHVATWGHSDLEQGDALRRHAQLHLLDLPGTPPLGSLVVSGRLARLAARLRPDIVHLHSGTHQHGAGALVGARTKVVLELHEGPSDGQWSAPATALARTLARRRCTTVVVHSARVRADIAWEWGVGAELIPLDGARVEAAIAAPVLVDLTEGARSSLPESRFVLTGGPARRHVTAPVMEGRRGVRSVKPDPVQAMTSVYRRLVTPRTEAR